VGEKVLEQLLSLHESDTQEQESTKSSGFTFCVQTHQIQFH